MSIELIPLCTAEVTLADPIVVGDGPAGMRLIFEVTAAEIRGDRFQASLEGRASADWIRVKGEVGSLDVRATVKTNDGAVIYAQYTGRTDVSGGPGTAPIYVAPTFETGDPRYAWLNAIQAIGKGILDGLQLSYEWYEVR